MMKLKNLMIRKSSLKFYLIIYIKILFSKMLIMGYRTKISSIYFLFFFFFYNIS